MTHPPRKQSPTDFYHLYSRGNGRQIIFEDPSDNDRFLFCLARALKESNTSLYAYCLMSNHYHLVIKSQYASLADFAYELNCNYARYFNRAHNHVGHLFQDRFCSEPIHDDEYFLSAIRYVHRNPVEARITTTCDYPWSSYAAYLEASTSSIQSAAASVPVETSTALAMLGGVEAFKDFHAHSGKQSFEDDAPMRTQLATADILSVARRALDGADPLTIKSLPRKERDRDIRLLKSSRLSIRQIALITGISRSAIQRVR